MSTVERYIPKRDHVIAIQWDGNQSTYAAIVQWFDRIKPSNPPAAVQGASGKLRIYNGDHGYYYLREGDYLYLHDGDNYVYAKSKSEFETLWKPYR